MNGSKSNPNDKILLNDLLQLEDLSNVKIRFNLMFEDHWNPADLYKNRDFSTLERGQYWNYNTKKSFKEGQITIGLLRLYDDLWLLFHIGKVTKDLDTFNGVGYEYESLAPFTKYSGRLIVKFKNKAQTMIRKASSVIDHCEIHKILPETYNDDEFPGYDNVKLSWHELAKAIKKDQWKTALENQKGVYLITDVSNGKMYVGSASGENMLLGRWESYIKTGHGGNVELRKLSKNHIRENFEFSILDIFKAKTADSLIINREIWWKNILKTKEFGYNKN